MPATRVVDEHVEASEPLGHLLHDALRLSRLGDVARHEQGIAQRSHDLCRRSIAPDDRDAHPVCLQPFGDLDSEARRSAGDQSDASRCSVHVLLLSQCQHPGG